MQTVPSEESYEAINADPNVIRALDFLQSVKLRFKKEPNRYRCVLQLIEFVDDPDEDSVFPAFARLLQGHSDLIEECKYFLHNTLIDERRVPAERQILPISHDRQENQITLKSDQQLTRKRPYQHGTNDVTTTEQVQQRRNNNSNKNSNNNGINQPTSNHNNSNNNPTAVNFLKYVKNMFSHDEDKYNQFLTLLHSYESREVQLDQVLERISVIFAGHDDLMKALQKLVSA